VALKDDEERVLFESDIDLTRLAFIGEDLTKMSPHSIPMMVIRVPQTAAKNEYFTVENTFIKLMSKDYLTQCLTQEVVQKRVKESIELNQDKGVEVITLFYKKLANLNLIEAQNSQT
jgi:formaldehyde-activating enzyme involved in methanogenesis